MSNREPYICRVLSHHSHLVRDLHHLRLDERHGAHPGRAEGSAEGGGAQGAQGLTESHEGSDTTPPPWSVSAD